MVTTFILTYIFVLVLGFGLGILVERLFERGRRKQDEEAMNAEE
jgi:NhaP-type Na+/H+ or K+/H+ antiporter